MGDTRHFIVTLIALLGGGWLMLHEPSSAEWVKLTATGILSFWFGAKVSNGNGATKP